MLFLHEVKNNENNRCTYAAVELLSKGVGNRVIGLKDNKIVDYDIFEALNMVKAFDQETYRLANTISI